MSANSTSLFNNIKTSLKTLTPSGRQQYEKKLFNKFKQRLVSQANAPGSDMAKNMGHQLLYQTYGFTDTYAFHPKDIYRPRERLSFRRRDQLYIDCAILRVTIDKVTKEIHRNGIDLKQEFVRKCRKEHIEPCMNPIHEIRKEQGDSAVYKECGMCPNPDVPLGQDGCEEEYQTEQTRCIECGFPTRPPKIMQKRKLRRLTRGYINNDNQTLLQVLTHVAIDVEKHDNGFIISKFVYTYENEDDIKPSSKTWVQTYRGNPSRIRPVINKLGSLGSKAFTCIKHRTVFIEKEKGEYNREVDGILRCDENISAENQQPKPCNEPLQRVQYVQIKEEGAEQDVRWCYIKDEVQHIKKYFPAGAMGVSLIDSLYYTILHVIGQEKWIAEYYLKMRMFKSFITAPTTIGGDASSIQSIFRGEFQKWRNDPYYVPIFGVPPDSKHGIEHHRLDDTPQELQFTEQRQEGRQQIANAYGMSNVWMNDTSTGAGLNNQGIEIAITNRHVEWGQSIMTHSGTKPMCASILDIKLSELEYYIGYNSHEEQDLMAEKQRTALDIANARAAQEIGAEVYIDSEGEFQFSSPKEGEPLVPLAQQQMKDKQSYQDVEGIGEEGLPYERRSQSKPMQGGPNEPRVSGSGITTKMKKGDAWKVLTDDLDEKERKQIINIINNSGNGTTQKADAVMYHPDEEMAVKESGPVTSTTPGAYNPVYGPRNEEEDEEQKKIPNEIETTEVAMKFNKEKVTWKDIYKPDFEDNEKYELKGFETIKIDDVEIPDDFGITINMKDTINRIIDNPKNLPAVIVTIDDGKYQLLDGFKRIFALKELNISKIRVAVVLPKLQKEKDPEFEQKHPRDEEGKFAPKRGDGDKDGNGEDGSDSSDDFATGQGSDYVETTGQKPKTVQTQPTGGESRKMPVDMSPIEGPELLEHAKEFDGFILTQDMNYYPGGGFWVGTPTKIYTYNLKRLNEKKLDDLISDLIDISNDLPQQFEYVISAWVKNNYLFMTIGEIYDEIDNAMNQAQLNGELEIWDFDSNVSVKVGEMKKDKEIIYDFFHRRYNYWKDKQPMGYDEYTKLKEGNL